MSLASQDRERSQLELRAFQARCGWLKRDLVKKIYDFANEYLVVFQKILKIVFLKTKKSRNFKKSRVLI
jgi:hypothetical protein